MTSNTETVNIHPANASRARSRESLDARTELFDNRAVKGSEFLRKVKRLSNRNKLAYRWVPERGVGSHGTVYLGSRLAIVKDLKKELGPGLLADMCRQLGIRKEDL
jgi:mRNA interferase HicA